MKPIICEITTTYAGGKDWVIGPDQDSIIEYYADQMGCEFEEIICTLIPEEEWSSMSVIDPDCNYDSEDYQDGDEVIDTFDQIAAKWDGIIDIIACDYE